jgi:CubicO group peptidase (beta-lactamase class C family)
MRKWQFLLFIMVLLLVGCGKELKEDGGNSQIISKWPSLTGAIDKVYADLSPYQTGGINAVIHKGQVLHLKGYGASCREFNVPWTPDTVYLLASVTKSITASALLKLVDQGLIAIDDPLHKYLPDFPDFDSPLTIRHLLNMTSGLWQDEALLPLSGVTGSVSLDTLYEISKSQQKLEYPPGSTFRYTDTNYRLLARIITLLTDSRDFSEALKKLLFDPLGMSFSSAPPDYWFVQDNQAQTYLTIPDSVLPPMTFDIHLPVSGDGGVRTTMNDFVRWLLYMREGIEEGDSRWQRLDQIVHLADGSESFYRLGVYRFEHRGLQGLAHGGFTGTEYVFFPEIDLIMAYFHNDLGTLDRIGLARTLIDAFLMSDEYDQSELARHSDWEKQAGAGPEPVPVPGAKRIAGHYVYPQDGLILVLNETPSGGLRVSYKGSGGYGLSSKDGTLLKTTRRLGAPAIEIKLKSEEDSPSSGVYAREIYWDEARLFKRVRPMDAYEKAALDIEGFYYSKALDVFYSVRFEDSRYMLRIGSGAGPAQKFRLIRLLDDVYEVRAVGASFYDVALGLGRFGVKFDLMEDNHVTGFRIITDRVQNLNFQKVSGIH